MKFERLVLSDMAFFGLLLAALILTAGGHIVQGDEETMFRVTQNLVEGRGLAVGREEITLPAQEYPSFLPVEDEVIWTTSAAPGRNDLLYSWYGIGQSIVVIPLYVLGSIWEKVSPLSMRIGFDGYGPRLFVSMLNPLALAGCSWVLFVFCRGLGYQNSTGRWISAAFAFSSMAWPYVKTFYPQPSVALLLLIIVFTTFRWRSDHKPIWIWSLSLVSFLLVLFRPSAIIVFPAIVVYLFLSNPRTIWWKWMFPLSTGIGSAVLITLVYNWLRFGSILSTGYNDVISWSNPFILGLYGLLFSPGKSVFIYTPVLILCLVAMIPFARKYRFEAILIGLLWLSFLGFYAGYNFWTGGFNWGPRFLLPLLPITLLPLGSLVEGHKTPIIRYLFVGLILLGVCIQIPAIIVDHSRYLSRHLAVEDQSQAYNQTLYDVKYSPLSHQWGEVLGLIGAYGRPEAWQAASMSLDRLKLDDQGVRNGEDLLVSEFLRRNTLDFWWLHIYILSFSTIYF